MSLLRRIQKGSEQDGSGDEPAGTPGDADVPHSPVGLDALAIRLRTELVAKLDPSMDTRSPEVRSTIEELFSTILAEENIVLSRAEKTRLFQSIMAEMLGFGPLEALLADESVSKIMVNGYKTIYVDRHGRRERANVSFDNEDHLLKTLNQILAVVGKHIDETNPIVRVKLPDGSELHAIARPVAMTGPTITFRKFSRKPFTVEDLIRFGTLTPQIAEFLRACVIARLNVIVSGSGWRKAGITTLLNVLARFIPNDERIVAIESVGEFVLPQEQIISLVPRHPDLLGHGEVTMRDLVQNAAYMSADRIILDECRSGEALDLLRMMKLGHDGTLVALHTNGARDALQSLESMCRMADRDLPTQAIRELIATTINLIVNVERMRDGSCKVVNVSEIQDIEGDAISEVDIFKFEEHSDSQSSKVVGRFQPTGVRPNALKQIEYCGVRLPPSMFDPGAKDDSPKPSIP